MIAIACMALKNLVAAYLATLGAKVALMTTVLSLEELAAVVTASWEDLAAGEISPSGSYVAGGALLSGLLARQDLEDEEGYVDAADNVWTELSATVNGICIHLPATGEVLAYYQLDEATVFDVQNVKLAWNADGLLRII